MFSISNFLFLFICKLDCFIIFFASTLFFFWNLFLVNSFIIFPNTFLEGAIRIENSAFSVPLPVDPSPLKNSSIIPIIFPKPIFPIKLISPHIPPAIPPPIYPLPMHHIIPPLSLIAPAITMPIHPLALNPALPPLPLIHGPIAPPIDPLSLLDSPLELPLIDIAITPFLNTIALRLVVVPWALVIATIFADVTTDSLGLVGFPVALVGVALDVGEFALAVCHIFWEVTFICGTIWPYLFAVAFTDVVLEISHIYNTRFVFYYACAIGLGLYALYWVFLGLGRILVWEIRHAYFGLRLHFYVIAFLLLLLRFKSA